MTGSTLSRCIAEALPKRTILLARLSSFLPDSPPLSQQAQLETEIVLFTTIGLLETKSVSQKTKGTL